MRALENRIARRRNDNPFMEQQQQQQSDNDSDEEVLNRRRNLGFLKYADESKRSVTSMSRTREHAKQIAMALSNDDGFADFGSAFDDPTESTTQTSWLGGGSDPFATETDSFAPEPDLFASPVKLSAWEASPSVTRKAVGRNQQKKTRVPSQVPSASYSTPQKQKPNQTSASNSAAARRRMRQNMRQKDDSSQVSTATKQKPASSPQHQSFFSEDSFASGSLWPTEETAAKITPRSSQQSFFEPKTISTGLSFDAFGLDGTEMKKTVNTAMLDLNDEFAVTDWGDSTNSSVDSQAENFVVHKPPTTVVETAQLPSERSSLTESSEQRGSVNIFKEKAGFHKQPRRKVVRPTGKSSVRTESTAATTVTEARSEGRTMQSHAMRFVKQQSPRWEPTWETKSSVSEPKRGAPKVETATSLFEPTWNSRSVKASPTQNSPASPWVSPRSRMKDKGDDSWEPFRPQKIAQSQIARIQNQLGGEILSPEKLDALSESGGPKAKSRPNIETRSEGGAAAARRKRASWNAFPGTSPRAADSSAYPEPHYETPQKVAQPQYSNFQNQSAAAAAATQSLHQKELSYLQQFSGQSQKEVPISHNVRREVLANEDNLSSSVIEKSPLTYKERQQLEMQQRKEPQNVASTRGPTSSPAGRFPRNLKQKDHTEQEQKDFPNSSPGTSKRQVYPSRQGEQPYTECRETELGQPNFQQTQHETSKLRQEEVRKLSYKERRDLDISQEKEVASREYEFRRQSEGSQRSQGQSQTSGTRQLSYKERRELELRQQQEEQAPPPSEEIQPDVREQIKRRVAAAKLQNHCEQDAPSCGKTEFSAVRNKLKPVGKREDESRRDSQGSSRFSPRVGVTPTKDQRSTFNFQGKSNSSFQREQTSQPEGSPKAFKVPARQANSVPSPSDQPSKIPTQVSELGDHFASASQQKSESPHRKIEALMRQRSVQEPNYNRHERQAPVSRHQVEDVSGSDLAFESSSSGEDQQGRAIDSSTSNASAAAAISQSLLMRQIQRRKPSSSDVPPAAKSLSVVTSDVASENASEDRNRTPKATMMMLNAFLQGRESVASSDGPTVATEAKAISETDPVEVRKSPLDKHSLPALKDDPKYEKYFKMLKIGMPTDVVKHAMTRDGLDGAVLDGDHTKPVGVPLKDDPTYAKYFRMLKIGLPMDAVKHSMERDGLDSAVMDQDHDLPVASQKTQDDRPKEQDSHRRARLHWKTLRKVTSNSLWARIDKDPSLNIEIDEDEFQELFQAEKSVSAVPNTVQGGAPTKNKPSVCVIDAKRANNGGIILARLKMSHDDMADAVDRIDEHAMTTEQIENIIEYLPSKEEKRALESYMLGGGQDAAEKFDALCECEKFMVSMMTVKHAKRKVSAILFKLQFETCVRDIQKEACLIEKACTELHESVRLRQLLGIVLTFGNRLNTAGNGKRKAGAFTLDSLLKLRQAKAFDKKTTFLHYIVLIVQRNNRELLEFKDDLGTVFEADKIFWDQCIADLEQVEHQLENVRKIALYQSNQSHGYRIRKKSKKDDPDESLTDEDEDLTLEDEVENLRSTPIGMFTLSAIKYISQLREKVESTKTMFAKLLEYFGEEESAMQPHELFNIIVRFNKDFEKAKTEVAEKQRLKDREDRRQQTGNSGSQHGSAQKKLPAKHPPGVLLKASSHQPSMSGVLKELKSTPFKLRRTSSDGLTQLPSQEKAKPVAHSDVGRRPSPRMIIREAPPSQCSSKVQESSPGDVPEAIRRVVQHNSNSSATSISMTAMRAKAKLRHHHAGVEDAAPSSPTRRGRGSVACDDLGAEQPVSPRQVQQPQATRHNNTLSPRSAIRMKRRVQQRSRNT